MPRSQGIREARNAASDADFNQIFNQNHGAEMRDYYARRTPSTGNHWTAMVDGAVGRGRTSRTPRARGAE